MTDSQQVSIKDIPAAGNRLAHPAYRPDIDGLRAIAVLSVVVFHAFPSLLRGGFIGVDVFFVISGFLISSILFGGFESGRFGFAEFYARRIRRIFPALLLVLVTCLGLGWFLLIAQEYAGLGKHVAAGAAFVSNFALWDESGYFDAAAGQKPLLHLWSLGIEEQFYLFWPILVWLAYRQHRSFLALTLSIAAASFILNIVLMSRSPVAAFYSPLSRFWELMVGGILAYITLHRPRSSPQGSSAWSIAGLILIGIGFVVVDSSSFPGWWALLPTAGSFLIIFGGRGAWLNRLVLGNRWLAAVGLISYPLYLWHWPVLFFAESFSTLPSRITRLLAVLLSVVLAILTYRLVELPIKAKKYAHSAVVYLSIGMAVCGVLGIVIFLAGGVNSRLPPQFARFARSSIDDSHSPCFLLDSAVLNPACTAQVRRPTVFIWGDSHADRLFFGFKPLQDRGEIGLMQVTAASCPPLLNFKRNGNVDCEQINSFALARIDATKPDVVLLHANWSADTVDLTKLDNTVRQLKRVGASNIVLIGPVPLWSGTILRSLFRCWRPVFAAEPFPQYSNCGVNERVAVVDAQLRHRAERLGIRYISAYAIFCKQSGCLTYVDGEGGEGEELTTYDYGHLSAGAARYLVNAIGSKWWSQRTAYLSQ